MPYYWKLKIVNWKFNYMLPDFKKKKNNILKQFLLVTGGILILIFIGLLIVSNVRIYYKRQKLISQIESLKNKIEDIKNKNSELKKGILEMNDVEYLEKVAREELSLQKPGEKAFSFIKEQNQSAKDGQGKKSFWQSWVGWIGGWFKR